MSKKYSTSLIGIGALGSRFLSFLQNSKNFKLKQIISTKSYQEFKIPSQVEIVSSIENLDSKIEVVFLCLPDSLIFETLEKIEKLKIEKLTVVCFSGSLTPNQKLNFSYGFLHPVNSFPEKNTSHNDLKKIFWNLLGDSQFSEIAKSVVSELEGQIFELKSENSKPLYHTSCVLASNLVTSLLTTAEESLSKALQNPKQAKTILHILVKSSVENYFLTEKEKALSGPVKRKDFETVEKNLNSLKNDFPQGIEVYKSLSKNLLKILDTKFSESEKQKLLEILEKP